MKRHHVAALFLLIFGGLFAYLRFNTGDTDGAIRTAIIFAILGVFLFFFGRLQPRLRSLIVNVILLIVVGVSAYRDFIAGDMVSVVILGILMILGIVMVFFQNKPLIKNDIEPWLKPVSRIGLVVSFLALVVLLLLLFFLR